ncbi:GNAT family N-acetyltransferase (plasmid) [Clostridium tyrobutyricum]|uniref:GNAT family N-acetyltransferase n=1 Tax=Clostridium tyrobutyricum TaxID=1519 RepID=UPI0039F6FD59
MSKDKYFDKDLSLVKPSKEIIISHVQNPSSYFYIAQENDEIIGFIEAFYQKKDFYFPYNDYIYILHAYVEDKYRSFQVSNKLIKCVEEVAKKCKVNYIGLDVFEHNNRIDKLLEYWGYSIYKRRFIKQLKNF